MFEADRRDLLAMLTEYAGKSRELKEMLSWESYRVDVGAYLREHADGRWREAFVPLIRGLVADHAGNWEAQFGVEFDVPSIFSLEWFQDYELRFAQPIMQTTSNDISDLLLRGQLEGWGLAKTRNALGLLFDRYTSNASLSEEQRAWFGDRMPTYRRELIARTETIRASGAGSQAMLSAWGAPAKEWLATRDGRTRDSHLHADGQVVPTHLPFTVGGFRMMYPGDTAMGAPLSEICNCRCAIAPVMEAGE